MERKKKKVKREEFKKGSLYRDEIGRIDERQANNNRKKMRGSENLKNVKWNNDRDKINEKCKKIKIKEG